MRTILLAFVIAVLAGLVLVVAGPGVRAGLWHYRTAFTLMKYAAYGGIAAAVLTAIGLAITRPTGGPALLLGLLALFIAGATVYMPWRFAQKARSVPPIHDITTDTQDPPRFVEIVPLRADAPNPTEYGGPEVADQQREAYPEIETLELSIPRDSAFERALAAARHLGWEIVAADRESGRIEAVATTFWFGFKDDVVVRIEGAEDGGSRVDARSVSRVGRSDVGKNAARIRTFLHQMR